MAMGFILPAFTVPYLKIQNGEQSFMVENVD